MDDDIFSERMRAKREPDPYQYHMIPPDLGNQIYYILGDVIEFSDVGRPYRHWHAVWDRYCQEKGVPPEQNYVKAAESHCRQITSQPDIEPIFDIIEIAFRFTAEKGDPGRKLEKATERLNTFFRKASVGYQLVGNQIMRIDSEFLHSDVVLPALSFLQEEKFDKANRKFLEAHEHYRNERHEDCITCLNTALESVMKVICEERGWDYGSGTVEKLISTLSNKNFIPNYLQNHFQQFLKTLKSGLPIVRNKQSSSHDTHGEMVESYMARYALHLAATNILFLVQVVESENKQR